MSFDNFYTQINTCVFVFFFRKRKSATSFSFRRRIVWSIIVFSHNTFVCNEKKKTIKNNKVKRLKKGRMFIYREHSVLQI